MRIISIELGTNKKWFNREKISSLDEFKNVKKKFDEYILDRYSYEINTRTIQRQIEDEFDIFVKNYFHNVNMDISFDDIASLSFSKNGMFIVPLSNIAGMVFFTDKRKEFWDEFVKLCNFRQKDKLIKT